MLDVFGKPFMELSGSGHVSFNDSSKSAISFRFVQLHNGELFLLAKQREEAGCILEDFLVIATMIRVHTKTSFGKFLRLRTV